MLRTHLYLFSLIILLLAPAASLRADGNVEVEVNNNGDLRVRGQNNTNQCILVEETANGQLRFSDFDGNTTFNGNAILTVNGVFGDVRFDLKSGEKVLVLCDKSAGDFNVFGDLRITSTGSQRVIVITDDLQVVGRTDIRTKSGNDAVLLLDCDFEDRARINTGNGNDVTGTDAFSDFFDESQFQLGGGDDVAVFFSTFFALKADVRLGSGDDAAGFCDVVFEDEVVVNGNGGFDFFAENDTDFFADLILKSIEEELFGFDNFDQIFDFAFENDTFLEATDIINDLNLG